jgi:predicted PurR-regulated permease PerM
MRPPFFRPSSSANLNIGSFATWFGIATLIPLFGSQIMLLFFALYFMSTGDFRNAVLTLVIGYPLMSAWIDFYYRPVVMGHRVAIPPVMMMIGILAGVPFMGFVGFIIGPVLIALAVTGTKILGEVVHDPESESVQISAAVIAFALALPFFYLIGVDDPFLFATLIGIATLIPLFGSQIMLLLFALYFISTGDFRNAILTLVIGYPLLSAWLDFYYRPVVMGQRVAIPPVMMMIGILAGVPFMGIVGFIIGPVLIALAVTGTRMLGEVVHDPESESVQS